MTNYQEEKLREDIGLMQDILSTPVNEDVKDLCNNLLYSFLVELYGVCECETEEDEDYDEEEESTGDTQEEPKGLQVKDIGEFLGQFGFRLKKD